MTDSVATDLSSKNQSRWPIAAWAAIVFVIAILIRLPSCYESFWLDELHTAWTVWDDFADVSPRAEIGNQTPLYFQCVWLWKQIVGESEVALRMSSVLAIGLASALLVIGVTDTTNRLTAGVLSGGLLAVESNSIFFGTEFRPYAFVVCLSVLSTWMAVRRVLDQEPKFAVYERFVFVVSACAATLVHPTAIVGLSALGLVVGVVQIVRWWSSQNRKIQVSLADSLLLVVVICTAFSLMNSSLPNSWQHRSNWAAFGTVRDWPELWERNRHWWIYLLLVPVGFSLPTIWRARKQQVVASLMPAIAALLTVCVFFCAAYFEFVTLWHRRYFICALPMLVWSAGMMPMVGLPQRFASKFVGAGLAGGILLALMVGQGTVARWNARQTQLAIRGEGWRSAIKYINKHRDAATEQARLRNVVLMDTDLIEATILDSNPILLGNKNVGPLQRDYLRFPGLGPYQVTDALPCTPKSSRVFVRWYETGVKPGAMIGPNGATSSRPPSLWIISRNRSAAFLRQWLKSLTISRFSTPEVRRFGRVWVIRIEFATVSHP